MRTPIVTRVVRWYCPNCPLESVSVQQAPKVGGGSARFHPCPGLAGIMAPMIEVGVRCKVVAVEREDYLGSEVVRTDANGRPVMSVVTVRDNGQDCIAFAPTAVATGKGL
jgi:hypothetical protein